MVHEYTVKIVESHIEKGHDVILPYLLINHENAEDFETIAKAKSSDFYEVNLASSRPEAIKRLLQRGVWGEEGSPKLTENDLPEINELYDAMEIAMTSRGNVRTIESKFGNIEQTYKDFLRSIS